MLWKLPSTTMRVPRRGGCRYGYDPQRQMLRRRVETVGIAQLGRPYVPDLTVDWSWSGTVSGFDPGVLLKSWGRVAPSCPGTITTALVFGGTGREFSGVGASGLAADGDDPSRACPSTISRELARNGNRLGYRAYRLSGSVTPSQTSQNHRNSLNIGGWMGLLRRNSRSGSHRQSTNPMPSRSARLRCPVWPV